MNTYIKSFISDAVAEGRAHSIIFQSKEVEGALLTTGKCTIGYDSVLAILRVSGLSPEEQREAKLVLAKGLKDLHA